MAKASKPVALMQKNLTKEERELREEAEAKVKGKSDLVFEAPTDLVKEEKEVYLFLVNELKELNIINNLDIELLKMTSNAVVELRKARVNVRKYGQLIQKPDGSLQKNPKNRWLYDDVKLSFTRHESFPKGKRIAVFGIIPSCRLEIFGIRFDSYRKRGKECSHVCAERVRGEWISE